MRISTAGATTCLKRWPTDSRGRRYAKDDGTDPGKDPAEQHGRGHAQLHDALCRARHSGARAAARGGRAQARAAPHPVHDARAGAYPGQAAPQERAHRGRLPGQVPPARRLFRVRRHGAHGAAVQHARAARGRARQLRLGRRRHGRRHALYRGAHDGGGRAAAAGHRPGHRAVCVQL